MQTIQATTAAEAFDLYAAAREADLLVQGRWHDERDRRQLACGLGVLGPNVNGPGDCPASVMPAWLARMVPNFFDSMDFADAKDWGLRFYAELKRLDGVVPFSVIHDWQANVVAPLGIDWRTLKGQSTDAILKVQALHVRALNGDIAPRTEWFEALKPALRETYRSAYANADAYANANADAYANADVNADVNADAKKTRRQEAYKRLADGMVDCLARVSK